MKEDLAALLQNKTAIVTGSNRGIGKAIVELFAQHGAHVWACARRPSEPYEVALGQLAARCGVTITPVYFDLADPAQIKAGMNTIFAARRPVDILVNNAGVVADSKLFQMTTIHTMEDVFRVNFFAPMLLTQYVSRQMTKQKSGSIVNICSVAGLDGDPAQVEYVASKAALIAATKKLASELGVAGIRVNAVAPGLTETDMARHMSPDLMRATLARTIMQRLGQPSEVAAVVLFLASELSSFMTGQVIRVDGGVKGK
jgi:3-oxoacyl-[acyl-carrier protein] reductase